MRCIKDENGKALSEGAEIKGRWQRYFSRLLDGEVMEDSRSKESECREMHLDLRVCGHISKDEIKDALKKMTNGKAEGPD